MDFKEFAYDKVIGQFMDDMYKKAKSEKIKLKLNNCKISKKQFVKSMFKAIRISNELDILNTLSILKLGILKINTFTILRFLIFSYINIKKIVRGLTIQLYALLCILLCPILPNACITRLNFIYKEWMLDIIIEDNKLYQ